MRASADPHYISTWTWQRKGRSKTYSVNRNIIWFELSVIVRPHLVSRPVATHSGSLLTVTQHLLVLDYIHPIFTISLKFCIQAVNSVMYVLCFFVRNCNKKTFLGRWMQQIELFDQWGNYNLINRDLSQFTIFWKIWCKCIQQFIPIEIFLLTLAWEDSSFSASSFPFSMGVLFASSDPRHTHYTIHPHRLFPLHPLTVPSRTRPNPPALRPCSGPGLRGWAPGSVPSVWKRYGQPPRHGTDLATLQKLNRGENVITVLNHICLRPACSILLRWTTGRRRWFSASADNWSGCSLGGIVSWHWFLVTCQSQVKFPNICYL